MVIMGSPDRPTELDKLQRLVGKLVVLYVDRAFPPIKEGTVRAIRPDGSLLVQVGKDTELWLHGSADWEVKDNAKNAKD